MTLPVLLTTARKTPATGVPALATALQADPTLFAQARAMSASHAALRKARGEAGWANTCGIENANETALQAAFAAMNS